MSPFSESSHILYYQTSPPSSPRSSSSSRTATTSSNRVQAIEVRITPEMLCPFLPSAAKPAHEIQASPDRLPYISLVDLIVFKMDACGLRDSPHSKQQEVRDAAALLELATEHSALTLNDDQTRVVEENLAEVLRHAGPDKQAKAWWQARLRGKCDPDARKPATEVLTDLIEGMSLDMEGSGMRSPTSEGEASTGSSSWSRGLFGRTTSSSSKTSLNSACSSVSGNFSTSSSPLTPTTPVFPAHTRTASKDAAAPGPYRPRKFSTTPSNPSKTAHSRKRSVDHGMPRRHSQILTVEDFHYAQGLPLGGRFESTPDDDKLVTGSFL